MNVRMCVEMMMQVIARRQSCRGLDVVVIIVIVSYQVVDYGGRRLQSRISGGLGGEGEGWQRRGGSDRRHTRG